MIADLFETANVQERKNIFLEQAHRVFKETVRDQRSLRFAPAWHFWYECLGIVIRGESYELYLWSSRYIDELAAWIKLNCPRQEHQFHFGIYSEHEHILSIH